MLTEHAERFDDYWRAITRTEEFICQYGHTADEHWQSCSGVALETATEDTKPSLTGPLLEESPSSVDILAAYAALRPILAHVFRKRLIHSPPGGFNAFIAENCHHALVMVLNPPERWFGQIGILDSDEYGTLKTSVEEEEAKLMSLVNQLNRLSDSVRDVYEAVSFEPMTGDQIGRKVDVHPDNVRRYLSQLKKAGLIQHVSRVGYFRM